MKEALPTILAAVPSSATSVVFVSLTAKTLLANLISDKLTMASQSCLSSISLHVPRLFIWI